MTWSVPDLVQHLTWLSPGWIFKALHGLVPASLYRIFASLLLPGIGSWLLFQLCLLLPVCFALPCATFPPPIPGMPPFVPLHSHILSQRDFLFHCSLPLCPSMITFFCGHVLADGDAPWSSGTDTERYCAHTGARQGCAVQVRGRKAAQWGAFLRGANRQTGCGNPGTTPGHDLGWVRRP